MLPPEEWTGVHVPEEQEGTVAIFGDTLPQDPLLILLQPH